MPALSPGVHLRKTIHSHPDGAASPIITGNSEAVGDEMLLWLVGVGAAIGFVCTWVILGRYTAQSFERFKSITSDTRDEQVRLWRAKKIGEFQGKRVGASISYAIAGALVGVVLWALVTLGRRLIHG